MDVLVVDHREVFASAVALALAPIATQARYSHRWAECAAILSDVPLSVLIINLEFTDAGHDGPQVLDFARRQQPGLPIAVLSTHADPLARYGAEVSRSAGYVHMDLSRETLCESIALLAAGGRWMAEVPGEHPDFQNEELEVLRLLRQGRDREGVRSGLHGRMGDAEARLASLAAKLGTPDLPEMVAQAAARGLYDVPPKPLMIRPPRGVRGSRSSGSQGH